MKTFPPFRGFLLEEIIKDAFFQVSNAPLDPLKLQLRDSFMGVYKSSVQDWICLTPAALF